MSDVVHLTKEFMNMLEFKRQALELFEAEGNGGEPYVREMRNELQAAILVVLENGCRINSWMMGIEDGQG